MCIFAQVTSKPLADGTSNFCFNICAEVKPVAGMGFGTYMVCSPVAVQQFFDKRRTFAVGVTMTGISIGAFCWPPLTALLVDR